MSNVTSFTNYSMFLKVLNEDFRHYNIQCMMVTLNISTAKQKTEIKRMVNLSALIKYFTFLLLYNLSRTGQQRISFNRAQY